MIDLATDSIQNCFHPNTCVKNTSIDKTTESSVSRGTILHILPRNTLPLVFLGYIINSARLLTSGSFFSMTALLPASIPLHFRSLYPTFSISCGAHYFTMALTCSCWSCSPVKSQSKAHAWKNADEEQDTMEWQEWVVAKGAEVSDANLWKSTKLEGCTLGFHEKCKHEASKDRQGTTYVLRVWFYKHEQALCPNVVRSTWK